MKKFLKTGFVSIFLVGLLFSSLNPVVINAETTKQSNKLQKKQTKSKLTTVKIPEVIKYLKSNHEDIYAGLFENDEAINIGFKEMPDQEIKDKVLSIIEDEKKVNFYQTKYSQEDLSTIVETISENIDKSEDNIVSVSTHFEDQNVTVGFVNDIDDEKQKY